MLTQLLYFRQRLLQLVIITGSGGKAGAVSR